MGFELPEVSPEQAKDYFEGTTILDPGWYPVVIVDAAKAPNKKKTGELLTLLLETQDAEKVQLKAHLNIIHEESTTQKIGRGELAKIIESIGHKGSAITDTDQLLGRPFDVKVKTGTWDDNGTSKKTNNVCGYAKAGVKSGQARVEKTASAPQETAGTSNRKW